VHQLIQLQETRDLLQQKQQDYQSKVKAIFDRKDKTNKFLPGDLMLRWDSSKEKKGHHEKFDKLWFVPFRVTKALDNNTFILQNIEDDLRSGPVNGRFLKHLFY
jgi:hypothetical protein